MALCLLKEGLIKVPIGKRSISHNLLFFDVIKHAVGGTTKLIPYPKTVCTIFRIVFVF